MRERKEKVLNLVKFQTTAAKKGKKFHRCTLLCRYTSCMYVGAYIGYPMIRPWVEEKDTCKGKERGQ